MVKKAKWVVKKVIQLLFGAFVFILLIIELLTNDFDVFFQKNREMVLLIGALVVIIFIAFLGKLKNDATGNKMKNIEKIIGEKSLFKKLWWEQLQYPIIGIGWDYAEAIHIKTRETCYKNFISGDFSSAAIPAYVIDAEYKKRITKQIKLSELWIFHPQIKDTSVYKLENTWETVDINELKSLVKWGAYKDLEGALDNSKNLNDLTDTMDKGNF